MPKYRLEDVRAAILEPDGLELGDFACTYRLMEDPDEAVFETLEECEAFAVDVLNGLKRDEIKIGPPTVLGDGRVCDEYGVELSQAMLDKHGLTDQSTWYVKFALRTDGQRSVWCVSLHRLEFTMKRPRSELRPKW